jgi:hypothetical protein
MNCINLQQYCHGESMSKINAPVARLSSDESVVKRFNYNKLQAVLCIASSSFVSVALIIWAYKALFN